MSHPNAPLTPEGRRRLCVRVDDDRPLAHVAAEAGIARQTLGRWYARWRVEGEDGLEDRSSHPESSPNQTDPEVEARVCALRRWHKVGPVQLVGKLAAEGIALPASTIYRVLVRHGLSRLRDLDTTGEDLREPTHRYEWDHPGDLVHLDVKKLGRIRRRRRVAGPRPRLGATPSHRPRQDRRRPRRLRLPALRGR